MANLLAFARDPTGTLAGIARDGGDMAFFRFGGDREVLIGHPDLIERVLVHDQRAFTKGRALHEARRVLGDGLLTSEGDEHLRRRRLIAPLFLKRTIAGYGRDMVDATERALARWRDGMRLDLHEELSRLTLAIVGRTVFDLDLEGPSRDVGRALARVIGVMGARMAIPAGHLLYRLPTPGTVRFDRARAVLDTTIAAMRDERRRRGTGGTDLLSLLIETGGLDDRAIRDEAMTIMLAGHETTAVWLTWTLMYVADRPPLAAALRDEVRGVAADRPLRVEDIPALPLAERTLRESLRLSPPAWIIGRRAARDVEIGGRTVPRGTIAVLCPWLVHRDARWYQDPLDFRPERWTAEMRDALPRFAFFPFGGGVRRCIGEGFAWMEATLILGSVVRDWDLVRPPGQVRLSPRITLRPRGGLPVTLHRAAGRPARLPRDRIAR